MQLFDIKNKKIWVAGHNGMVGAAIVRELKKQPCEIITIDRNKLDLEDRTEVEKWINEQKPQYTILAAAKVGGIYANDNKPVDFLKNNLDIQNNVISACARNNVERLLFLGSSCVYPGNAKQPIDEDQLLKGPLEKTNQWYAIAKISGIFLCQAYRKQYQKSFVTVMPTNLYGEFDNFNLQSGHVLASLIHKIHLAKINKKQEVTIWGTGKPKREFLYVDDLARAVIHVLTHYDHEQIINAGYGKDISITELAKTIAKIVGWSGQFQYDLTKPDGMPLKLIDSTKINQIGWKPQISLEKGIEKTYRWFVDNQDIVRKRYRL